MFHLGQKLALARFLALQIEAQGDFFRAPNFIAKENFLQRNFKGYAELP